MNIDGLQARASQLFESHVRRCTVDLFRDHDLTIAPIESHSRSRPNPKALAGIIGFVGDVSGTLLLAVSAEVAASCHPLRSSNEITERMCFDWVGELANQLTGRLKLRLAEHGLDVRLSAPISIACARIRHLGVSGETCRVEFRAPQHTISVWIDAALRHSFRPSDAFFSEHQLSSPSEGTITFL